MLSNFLYLALLALVSPILAYRMIRYGRYRRGLGEKLRGLSYEKAAELRDGKDCVWLHGVSVGEIQLLPPVVEQLQSRCPDHSIVISTSTDTGYDLAVKLFGASRVFFCPLDFSWATARTVKALQPSQLILTELELWPNLIRTAKSSGVRVRVINGRLSERSAHRYQQFSRFTHCCFAAIDWVGCHDEESAVRFIQCGVAPEMVTVTGSIKIDNAPDHRDLPEVQELAHWAAVAPWHRVWIVGSTQAGEEEMAISVYKRLSPLNPELRLILVPRHVERFGEVAKLIQRSGFTPHRRSSDGSVSEVTGDTDDATWETQRVILVDTIGELRSWWGVGHIATVGGSFGNRGGQNMLEPAGYGLAVSFGPNTKNFKVIANGLVAAGGAIRLRDELEMERFVRRCLGDVSAADALGLAAQAVVAKHRGAIGKTVDVLAPSVNEPLPIANAA